MNEMGMLWWRVVLDKDGSIKECTQVEATGKGGGHVRYLQANTKAEACSYAKAWYEKYKATKREAEVRRLLKCKAEGRCTSCRKAPARPGKVTCQACCNQVVRRRKDVREGREQKREILTPEETLRRVRERQIRCNAQHGGSLGWTLQKCLKQFDALGPEAFRAWLVAEIERRVPTTNEPGQCRPAIKSE
jgi:hypothetical protein